MSAGKVYRLAMIKTERELLGWNLNRKRDLITVKVSEETS